MHVTPYNADFTTIAKYNEPYAGPSDWRGTAGSVDMTRIDVTLVRVQLVLETGNSEQQLVHRIYTSPWGDNQPP